jgi:YVTN family beta-propeller protein/autotransporter-associated beta strand protein
MNALGPRRWRAARIIKRISFAARTSHAWAALVAAALLVPLLAGEARAQTGPSLYVPNTTGNNVWVVDTSTAVVSSIPTAFRSFSLAVKGDQSWVYVSNYLDGTVTPINTATNTAGTPIPVGVNPYGIAMTPDGTTVYVANNSGTTVSVINTATNTVTATIAGFSSPTAVVITPDGKTAYVTDQTIGKVTPIDIATNTAGTPITVGAGPFFLAVSPDGKTVYVANSAAGTVSVINTVTNTVTATVTVGGFPIQIVVTPDGKTAYVTNQSTVTPINTATNAAGTPISFGPGTFPFGLTVSPDGKTLYVELSNGGSSVGTIGTATNTIGAPLAVTGGQFPGMCSNGNALLASGLTFVARSSGALGCTLASGPTGSPGPVFTGGTLQFAGAGIASALPISLQAAGGTFDTNGNNAVLSGDISGPGSFTKIGSGTLTLSGSSAYTGGTFVNVGTLQAGAANVFSPSSAFRVTAGAFLDLNNFNQTIGSLAGAGTVTLGGATLTTGNDGTSTAFSGAISGAGGLTKIGAGTFTLTGTSSYGGATNINAGTLEVDGSIANSSSVTVNSGGTLSGTGIVDPATTTIMNGGTLAPGNASSPTGTLSITGNLAFQSGALYLVQITPSGASSTAVSGTATLGSAMVKASFAAGAYVAKQYTILHATGGLGGSTFGAQVNTNLPSGFTSSLGYDTNNAYLNFAMNFGGGLSGNQQNVGNALVNFFNTTGGIPVVFGSVTPAGLTQLSGEAATGLQQTTFDAMNQFMGILTDPFIVGRGDSATPGGATPFAQESDSASAYASQDRKRTASERDAYAAVYAKAPPRPVSFDPRWSVWSAGFGGSQTTSGNATLGTNSTTSRLGGVAAGADYRFSPYTIAGFALAGGGTSFSLANGLGSGRSDLFQAGAFVRHTVGPAYISTALAYGWQDITTDRTVTVAGLDQLRAKFDANAFSGRVEGGYRFVTPWMATTPYAAGQFTTFDLPAYAEQAIVGTNMFALAYASKSVTATRSELGLRIEKSFAMQDGIFTLRGRAAWAHDYDTDRNIGATFQTLPGASFVVNGAAAAHDGALTTASAEWKWPNGFSLAGSFEGEFSNVNRSYAGKSVVRYQW